MDILTDRRTDALRTKSGQKGSGEVKLFNICLDFSIFLRFLNIFEMLGFYSWEYFFTVFKKNLNCLYQYVDALSGICQDIKIT